MLTQIAKLILVRTRVHLLKTALESLMFLIDSSSLLRMTLILERKASANKIQTNTYRLTPLSENGTDSYNQKKTEKIRTF